MSDVSVAAGVQATRPGIAMRWDSVARLLSLSFPGIAHVLNGDDAAWVLAHVRTWTGGRDAAPYGFLVDCAGIERADVGWRAAFNEYYREFPRGVVRVAWFNLSVIIRVVVEMFAIANRGIEGKTFGSEAAAAGWLRSRGHG